MQSPTKPSRPRSVTALGLTQIVLGIFSFFGGFVHIFLGIGSIVTFSGSYAILGTVASLLGTSLVVFGVLFLIAGIATIGAYRWAWTYGVRVALAGLVVGVISLGLGTVGAVPEVALAVGILWMLRLASVRSFLAISG